MSKFKVIDIALIPIFAAILFAQEQILSFLPNIQLTIFLLILFAKKLGFIKTSIIIIIHVLLDNLFMGSFNIIYVPFMAIGWLIIPLTITTIMKKVENPLLLAIASIFFALIYSWIFIIPNIIILNVNFWDYLIADFIFEIILAISSFISTLWLYKPCSKVINMVLKKDWSSTPTSIFNFISFSSWKKIIIKYNYICC